MFLSLPHPSPDQIRIQQQHLQRLTTTIQRLQDELVFTVAPSNCPPLTGSSLLSQRHPSNCCACHVSCLTHQSIGRWTATRRQPRLCNNPSTTVAQYLSHNKRPLGQVKQASKQGRSFFCQKNRRMQMSYAVIESARTARGISNVIEQGGEG